MGFEATRLGEATWLLSLTVLLLIIALTWSDRCGPAVWVLRDRPGRGVFEMSAFTTASGALARQCTSGGRGAPSHRDGSPVLG